MGSATHGAYSHRYARRARCQPGPRRRLTAGHILYPSTATRLLWPMSLHWQTTPLPSECAVVLQLCSLKPVPAAAAEMHES
eukprot:2748103-Prymnesium_polylepis.8